MVRSKRFFMKFYLVLIIAFLYIPIAVLVVLSFNNSRSRVVWGGFTLEWYKTLFHNSDVVAALQNTLTIGFGSALIATIIGVLAVYYGVAKWNDYWTGLVYINRRELLPLQTILKETLASLQSSRELLMSMVSDSADSDAELLNRAQIAKYCIIVVSTVPAVVLYLCMQKFFVKGVMIGSIKG